MNETDTIPGESGCEEALPSRRRRQQHFLESVCLGYFAGSHYYGSMGRRRVEGQRSKSNGDQVIWYEHLSGNAVSSRSVRRTDVDGGSLNSDM
ncbi:unnamed protein product [Caenorhabditis brenneri]